jgi:hypothetical protein
MCSHSSYLPTPRNHAFISRLVSRRLSIIYNPLSYTLVPRRLLTRGRLAHHLGLLLLEALADALAAGHELGDAPRHAAGLARHEGFGGEVIDARLEAVVDEVGEHLERVSGMGWIARGAVGEGWDRREVYGELVDRLR